jgi:hypothetical protein
MKASATINSSQPNFARRWMALGVAVLITLTGGILYGNYSQRWNVSSEMRSAADHLGQLPREIGKWKAVEDMPIAESALQMLECAAHINRRYVNEETGKSLQLAIMLGPPGPIAVHTPEICYSSRAYEIKGERSETVLDVSTEKRHSFWTIDFVTRNAFADRLRVYYAWSDGRNWIASNSPRFEFAGAPLLYKLQLATHVSPYSGDEGADPCRQFLEELLESAWAVN